MHRIRRSDYYSLVALDEIRQVRDSELAQKRLQVVVKAFTSHQSVANPTNTAHDKVIARPVGARPKNRPMCSVELMSVLCCDVTSNDLRRASFSRRNDATLCDRLIAFLRPRRQVIPLGRIGNEQELAKYEGPQAQSRRVIVGLCAPQDQPTPVASNPRAC